MQAFKKELFQRAHGSPIPNQSVSESDFSLLKDNIDTKIGKGYKTKDFFALIQSRLEHSEAFENLETSEEIQDAFEKMDLLNQKFVIVIWDYPNDLDKFDLEFLIKYWEDIWFGISDDACCLFFPEIEKIMMLTHWNIIYH